MLEGVLPLLKKDLCESVNKLKARKVGGGVVSYIMYFIFIAAMLVTAIFLYAFVAQSYINLSNNPQTLLLRQKELLTLTLSVVFLLIVLSGTRKICKKIVIGADMDKLNVLPISSKNLFIYKVLYIFINQFIVSFICLLTFGITFGVVCRADTLFYFMLILAVFIFPFITMGVSALLVIPYYYFIKFTHSKYVLLIVIYTVLFVLLFAIYSEFLNMINNILVSGGLKTFFNEQRFSALNSIVKVLYPTNMIAQFMLGENIFISLLITFSAALLSSGLLLLIVAKCFPLLSNDSMQENKTKFVNKTTFKQKSPFIALLIKEFTSILRRPSYAFSLFSISLSLPILVSLSAKLLSVLVKNVVYINLDFVLSLFVLTTFAMLTNTFCASNISREGKQFYKHMLLPLTTFQALISKVFVCFIVSTFAVVASAVSLMILGMVSVGQGVFIMLVVTLLCLAENLFATKLDLLKPNFVQNKSGESDMSTPSNNVSVLLSFIVSILLVGGVLLYSTLRILKGLNVSPLMTYLLPVGVSAILLVLAIIFFMYKLNKFKVVEE